MRCCICCCLLLLLLLRLVHEMSDRRALDFTVVAWAGGADASSVEERGWGKERERMVRASADVCCCCCSCRWVL